MDRSRSSAYWLPNWNTGTNVTSVELFCEQAVQFDFAAVVLKSAGRVTSSGGGQNVIDEVTSTKMQ